MYREFPSPTIPFKLPYFFRRDDDNPLNGDIHLSMDIQLSWWGQKPRFHRKHQLRCKETSSFGKKKWKGDWVETLGWD